MPYRWMLAVMVILGTSMAARASEVEQQAVSVMVLGTYHFANPGLDVVNTKVDDVLAPRRQRELEALAAALAEWKPDRIAVERQPSTADLSVPDYETFALSDLATERNEVEQIAYRLARLLGHSKVYGFDERPGEGEPDYFPYDKVQAYADGHGMSGTLTGLFDAVRAEAAETERLQSSRTVAELLLRENDPGRNLPLHAKTYYGMIPIGDADEQPGAELNAMWYMRNAKMFAKLGLIARPGETLLVLVGSGHLYWLKHFAEEAPGFRFVDPAPWLAKAAD